MNRMPSGWSPDPGRAYVAANGALWRATEAGYMLPCGEDGPPAPLTAEQAWEKAGPFIPAPRLAWALRAAAHETECVTGQTADRDAQDPALADAHIAYARAEALG